MASPVNRPTSAPPISSLQKKKIPQYDRIDSDKCSICFKKIFGGAFAEISHEPFSKLRQPICSNACFDKYVEINSQSTIKEPLPNTKKEIPFTAALPPKHKPSLKPAHKVIASIPKVIDNNE